MRNNDEKKRQKLINKLIFLNEYNKEDQQLLYKLPLSKLQYEYRRFNLQNHPHGEFGSIQFV